MKNVPIFILNFVTLLHVFGTLEGSFFIFWEIKKKEKIFAIKAKNL